MKTAKEPIQMSNNKTKWLLIFFLPALAIPTAYADDEPNQPDPNQAQYNPFAKFKIAGVNPPQREQSPPPPSGTSAHSAAIEKPPLFIQTIVIKFLEAQNLKTVVETMLSPFGSIAVDKASNSLIICDDNESLQKMIDEIRKVDTTPHLLQIEVVIVDVELNDSSEIGVNWDMLSNKDNTISFRQNVTRRIGSTAPTPENVGNASAYNSTGLGSDLSIVSGSVRNVIHLLQDKRKVEILASPTVMVVSGKTASVEAITEIPYQEQTDSSLGGGYASTQFKEVGVKLSVTATLADNNNILLVVEPEQNTNTGLSGINNIPIIDTRKAKSNLLLQNGEVVIMGGLRRKETTKAREQIPILGDIPLIGVLFGRDAIHTVNSELIVFISPHIYNGQPLTPEKLEKLEYAKNLKSVPLIDPNELKLLKRP
jgi:type II secretory pathway component GspD/PulD (secretin)